MESYFNGYQVIAVSLDGWMDGKTLFSSDACADDSVLDGHQLMADGDLGGPLHGPGLDDRV